MISIQTRPARPAGDTFSRTTVLSFIFLMFHGSILQRYGAFSWAPRQIQPNKFYLHPSIQRTRFVSTILSTSSPDDNTSSSSSNDQGGLLERARQLREQAKAMEEDLRTNPTRPKPTSPSSSAGTTTVEYTKLEDSIWTLSYRFSSQPAPEEDGDNSKEKRIISPRTFYSGKLQTRLKDDGYSEQLSSDTASGIQIAKIWGWDQEMSNEDNQEYVLFSVDIKLPATDPDLPNQTERYYFQARVDQEKRLGGKTILQLRDGTITVKKDVAEQTKGRWGLFNVAGILSQFRYCGDFVAKASSG